MAALKVSLLLVLSCLLSQLTNCQDQVVWLRHAEFTFDSADIVTFQCPYLYWRLGPGYHTMEFVEGVAGMREFYSNCMGSFTCKVNRTFWRSLMTNTPQRPLEYYPRGVYYDDQLLMCRPVEYFHPIDSTDRVPLAISALHWQSGYIYTTGTQSMELNLNITMNNPENKDINIQPFYLYDKLNPRLYDRMTMHIEGSAIGCVVLDHSEPRKWITTNMATIRIFFSSCSRSGRFGIRYLYYRAPGFFVPNNMVVMDGYTPLTGQHTCGQRPNRCIQPPPTVTPISTTLPTQSTPILSKAVTAQLTVPSAGPSVSSSSTSSESSEEQVDVPTFTSPRVTVQSSSTVANAFPDATSKPVSPDVTSQDFPPRGNTSGTEAQHGDKPGVGVVVGGSLAGGVVLAVLIILIVVLLRKGKCPPSRKQPDPPQRIESMVPTAPGMDTLLRESQQGSLSSSTSLQASSTPDIVPGSSMRGNPGNIYAVINRERRQPPPRPPRPVVRDDSLTIVENDLYSSDDKVPGHRGLRPSASVFIVENDGYDSVKWGRRA